MNDRGTREPANILMVDDNVGDTRLTKELMKDAKFRNKLECVIDGVEAMEYLRREGRFSNAARPDLILLDLNLPRKDGRDVLAEIKCDEDLKSIPVIVLTTSKAEEDVIKTYNLHANCYITKPGNLDRYVGVIQSIEDFWLSVVRLPVSEGRRIRND